MRRLVALGLTAVLLAACSFALHDMPHREWLLAGGPPKPGVAYLVVVSCPVPFELGGEWWSWDESREPWPPPMPDNNSAPYDVPGTFTMVSETGATFRADSNAAVFSLTGSKVKPDSAACF